MSLKWSGTATESGILRKSEFKEKKEELFVFGYSCKLFRDNDKALHIDQGKHLIPWMGDETLKIDRYDARGALHELGSHEAPPGGFDWRLELTKTERDVEQLCDEERYRALHTDEDEEEMYKEEELKRLHAAGYGQVGFNYDAPAEPEPVPQPVEVDEPFLPTPAFKALLPVDILLPETEKQNVIIEKTAKFIATQGAQMEILIKAKQGDNPQFQFLNRDCNLNPYYMALIGLVKAGKWPEKKPDVIEEKPPENEDYLHPSLAYSTIIESAPSIPSIQYKPSADCDYSLLVSRLRAGGAGGGGGGAGLAPGEEPPPGTEPLPPRPHPPPPPPHPHIQRAPVLYDHTTPEANNLPNPQPAHPQYAAYYQQYMSYNASQPPPKTEAPVKSTGLSLMKNYNTDSDSDGSNEEDTSSTDSKNTVAKPPEEIQTVIDKMASYVARNGAEFADIVRAKGDPRFSFLEPTDPYHAYYCSKLGTLRNDQPKKPKAPVSFSIKKLKEPDPILPKPALPYESSSDDENDKTDKETDKQPETTTTEKQPQVENHVLPKPPQIPILNNIKPIIYKIEATSANLPIIKSIEIISPQYAQVMPPVTTEVKPVEEKTDKPFIVQPEKKYPIQETVMPAPEKINAVQETTTPKVEELKKEIRNSATPEVERKKRESPRIDRRESPRTDRKDRDKERERESPRVEKRDRDREKESPRVDRRERERNSPRKDRKERDRKRNKPEREKRPEKRSLEKDRKKEDKKPKYVKDDLESEIISLEDNSDDMIDLTEDHSDSKAECDSETERLKQQSRRQRAADFLRKVGVDPAAAALPTSSLASAMVDTLESLRKKKAEAEEKRRKRDKKRHRDRYGYDDDGDKSHRKSKRRKYRSSDDDESDYDGSKRKKRRKDKKSSKSKKKKRREVEQEEEQDHALPPNIDLSTTLKELRTSSPTKELVLKEEANQTVRRESSEEEGRRKKKNREYSEGEWSSDSEGDSASSPSKNGD